MLFLLTILVASLFIIISPVIVAFLVNLRTVVLVTVTRTVTRTVTGTVTGTVTIPIFVPRIHVPLTKVVSWTNVPSYCRL